MENEIVIKENKFIRIYTIEEYEKYLNNKKYVSWEELLEVNFNAIFNATPKKSYKKV